jgi:HNH endonuclease
MSDDSQAIRMWMDIEDYLIPFSKLDAHERSVYYHLFRKSRLIGNRTVQVSIDSLARATGLSAQVRNHLRSLDAKGCIRIVTRNRTGTNIEVLSPSEIPGCLPLEATPEVLDLETFDFYTNPRGREAIMTREAGHCFYCLREVDRDSAVLDHAIPQVTRIDNSYRNVVACCHECNSLKSGTSAEDFVRLLYRRGRLSATELETRLSMIEALRRGELKPSLHGATNA